MCDILNIASSRFNFAILFLSYKFSFADRTYTFIWKCISCKLYLFQFGSWATQTRICTETFLLSSLIAGSRKLPRRSSMPSIRRLTRSNRSADTRTATMDERETVRTQPGFSSHSFAIVVPLSWLYNRSRLCKIFILHAHFVQLLVTNGGENFIISVMLLVEHDILCWFKCC